MYRDSIRSYSTILYILIIYIYILYNMHELKKDTETHVYMHSTYVEVDRNADSGDLEVYVDITMRAAKVGRLSVAASGKLS